MRRTTEKPQKSCEPHTREKDTGNETGTTSSSRTKKEHSNKWNTL